MIEPRTQTRGLVEKTYNKIRNFLNRNLQHKNRFMSDRTVVTPLRFENVSADGVHPRPIGRTQLYCRIFEVVSLLLYANFA